MTSARPEVVEELGAVPVVATAFDAAALGRAVENAKPDVIVNLLTRIPKTAYPMPWQFRENNLLRTRGTQNLLAAARAAGVGRMVAESIVFAFRGRTEDKMEPLQSMGSFAQTVQSAVSRENQTRAAGGIVLRFGYFYGPGTSFNIQIPTALRRRLFVILGKGTAWWSFIHLDDAAEAVLAALERGRPGETYNICDDEPILASDALGVIAETIGGKPPRRVPNIGPLFARHYFNRMTGANNLKAKSDLGWAPRYPTFREGYPATFHA